MFIFPKRRTDEVRFFNLRNFCQKIRKIRKKNRIVLSGAIEPVDWAEIWQACLYYYTAPLYCFLDFRLKPYGEKKWQITKICEQLLSHPFYKFSKIHTERGLCAVISIKKIIFGC